MFSAKTTLFTLIAAPAVVCALTVPGGDDLTYWVRIEAGAFTVGASRDSDPVASFDESPEHLVKLAAYDIGRHEVTVAEFSKFVTAGGYTDKGFSPFWDLTGYGEENRFGSWPAPEGWKEQLLHPQRPVTGVSWYEAMAFCRWLSASSKHPISLPTEAQWERAARGAEGRRFAWGDKIPDGTLLLNYDDKVGHPTDVGSHPDGNTPGPDPICDMAGNAWEWCLDRKVSYAHEPRAGDGLRVGKSEYRVVRGGSFRHEGPDLRATCRSGAGPRVRVDLVGFRLVRTVQE